MVHDERIFSKVREIVAEVLNIDEERIKRESKFVDDLGAESLDVITLVMDFEDEFNQKIPDEDISELITVGDVENFIIQKKGELSLKD